MKKLIIAFIAIASSFAPLPAKELPPAAIEQLKGAIGLVDQGMAEAAMLDLDALAKEYPDDYIVQYERLFALYHLEKYEEVAAGAKKLIKHKDATPVVFQMYGNVVDILGKPKEAIKIYKKGLKRFPDAGYLYLEIGNVHVSQNDYAAALASFNKGIDVQPDFSSNYYRAGLLYLCTEEAKVWGLVYAETSILLNPDNEERHSHMGMAIHNCFTDNISIEQTDGKTEAKISLAPSRGISLNPEEDAGVVQFPGVYEACALGALTKMAVVDKEFTGSIAQLAELRKGIVESYFSTAKNYYGNAMYLLPFQKKVIDAGHWEAYNYFIFGQAFSEEFNEWYSNNSDKFNDFVDWYNNDPFKLDSTHTVGIDSIYRDCERLNTIGTLMFHANLLKLSE